jgi:hypothetical protein
MNVTRLYDRRKVLRFIASLLALPLLTYLPWRSIRRDRLLMRQFKWSLSPSKHTRAIGRVYLEVVPEEAGPHRLERLLLTDTGSTDRAAVQHCVRTDFRVGRTVCLDGWVLSVTEARLCALTCLN